MFFQREYVREAVAMTIGGVLKLDLPEHGLLSSLLIRISGAEATGYGQTGGAWRIIDEISKVSVLGNASVIIKSLTGYQAQAMAFYDQGVIPPGSWRNYATNVQFEYMLINFGRWMFDTEVGLDLAKFNNVELQIENIATAATFSDLTVSIMGIYLRDVPVRQFTGYMRSEEWRSWATVQDQTVYNNLPTEHPIRRVVLQAIPYCTTNGVADTTMNNLMDDVEFSLDTGQIRVYKGGIDDLMRENFLDTGKPVIVGGFPYMNADYGIDMSLGYIYGASWGAGSQDGGVATTFPTMESALTFHTQKPESYDGDHPIGLLCIGMSPFLTVQFRFDHSYLPTDWLNPEVRKTVQLNIHTRNAATADLGKNAIVLDRYVATP